MYYPHHQSGGPSNPTPLSSNKHPHDNQNNAWGRHPFGPIPTPNPPNPFVNGPVGYPPHLGHGGHSHGHPGFGGGVNGGGGGGGGMYGGMGGMYGGPGGVVQGSPPRSNAETVPMTAYWQNQLVRAEASRVSSAPHHRARSAAVASRMSNKPAIITISDPNNRPPSVTSLQNPNTNGIHRKNTSLSVMSQVDRAVTPPPGDATSTTSTSHVDPANPAQAPAPTGEDEKTSEPWTGLDLGGIKLRTLSTALFAFTHITSLYINHNTLTTLPAAISKLRNLTLLDATGNELTSIPPEIGVLSKLKELLLFDNHLTTLPPEIGTLFQLEILGIDGNPIEERYRKIVAEEGTTALITHFRDTCPVGPAPPERQWMEIESDVSSPSSAKQESFTALSYNILCHHFAPPAAYSYTPSWALDWSYRKQTILEEIINASADIVCLQECEAAQYAEFFYPQLRMNGYEGCYYPRSRARTMSVEEAKQVDGCAIFWKDERFNLVETQVVECNQVGIKNTDMRTADMMNRVMSRDNIAAVAALEFSLSGARLLVASGHIYWDHRLRDVKLIQMAIMTEELEAIAERFASLPPKQSTNPEYPTPIYDKAEKGRDIPLVLCIDLNSFPDSAVVKYMSDGDLPGDHEDFMLNDYAKWTKKGMKHRLGLKSVASSFGEMKMTNYTPSFVAAIDYIFHTARTLKVTSVLGDVDKGYLDKVVGFPNAHFPSDHIPIFAQFRVKGAVVPPKAREVQHGYTR